jgi:hypothetical protein
LKLVSFPPESEGHERARAYLRKRDGLTGLLVREHLISALDEAAAFADRIQLQHDGDDDDVELLCSLDRIDSDGHYEAGNLQIVCRFVNRWKNDGDDAAFRRLIALVRR